MIYDGAREDGSQRLTRSFGASILGDYLGKAQASSLWLQPTSDPDEDPHLETFQRRRRLTRFLPPWGPVG